MPKPGSVPRVRTDLAYYGVVTRVISATQFVVAGLAGLGDGALVGYATYVMAKADGTTTPPHREQPAVTAYVSSVGIFTHIAYTAPLAVGDQLQLLHPNISTKLNEQADVAVNTTAPDAPAENNILNLAAADTRYIVRHLRLKCADPGASTVTVRLYELVNGVLTEVDSFAITGANFATYHSLMDMFGLNRLVGDELRVTVQATAAGPFAVTGQYSWASAT